MNNQQVNLFVHILLLVALSLGAIVEFFQNLFTSTP